MDKIFGKTWPADVGVELLGSVLTGIAVYNFALPAGFPMTGFSGLALIFYRLFSLPIGVVTVVLNIPVAILCWKLIGRQFFARSIRCMILSSLFIDLVAPLLPQYTGSRVIAAVCTGVLGGIGYAIIYLRNSSTGGSDFVVMAVKAVRPHFALGRIIFATDAVIVLLGGIIFRDFDGIVYGLAIDYIYAIGPIKIMYVMNAGKMAMIITDHGRETANRINDMCQRGTTILQARGGYKDDARELVLCACSNKDMIHVERAVRSVDPRAFTVILESNEVLGEGFRNIRVAEKE